MGQAMVTALNNGYYYLQNRYVHVRLLSYQMRAVIQRTKLCIGVFTNGTYNIYLSKYLCMGQAMVTAFSNGYYYLQNRNVHACLLLYKISYNIANKVVYRCVYA